ncbi:hypothetical protein ABWK43_06310 [Bacillus thuringiensis]|nr:hypothetical protein [Bacillus cereus]
MLWLKFLFIVLIFISQMYVISFQSSDDGRDERGKEIIENLKSMNMMIK